MGDVKIFRFKTSQGNYDIPVKDTTARERIGDLEQLQTPHKDNLVNAINDLEGGGGGGTSDYPELNNKPSINGVTLVGNKTTEDLGIEIITDYDDLENRPVESSDLDIDAVVYPLPEDLTEYVTESEFTETLSNYTNTTDLTTLLNAKQDTLTFDNVPTQSSNNPVKSGGVYSALSDKADASDVEDIEALIPSTATASNKLATMDDVGGVIDDTATDTDTTWSSSKIYSKIPSITKGYFTFSYTTANVKKVITEQDITSGTFPPTPTHALLNATNFSSNIPNQQTCGGGVGNTILYSADTTNNNITVYWTQF